MKILSKNNSTNRGFTLIEVMVAVSLFSVVMVISIGALLSLVDANRKAQAMQSVINNLNIALDGMIRSIRMGTNYHCGIGELYNPQDCVSTPSTQIAFESFDGDITNINDQWVYWLAEDSSNNNVKRIYRSKTNKTTPATPITAPEINISTFDVYVKGAEETLSDLSEDTNQPMVVISVEGVAGSEITSGIGVSGSKKKIETTFTIQATASQRLLDL